MAAEPSRDERRRQAFERERPAYGSRAPERSDDQRAEHGAPRRSDATHENEVESPGHGGPPQAPADDRYPSARAASHDASKGTAPGPTHPMRARIQAYVAEHPGIHMGALVRQLHLGWGNAHHHLARMERDHYILREPEGNRVRLFVPGQVAGPLRHGFAVLRNDSLRETFEIVAAHPGIIQRDVAAELGITATGARKHLRRLAEEGLIRAERAGGRILYRAVADPEGLELRHMLEEGKIPNRASDEPDRDESWDEPSGITPPQDRPFFSGGRSAAGPITADTAPAIGPTKAHWEGPRLVWPNDDILASIDWPKMAEDVYPSDTLSDRSERRAGLDVRDEEARHAGKRRRDDPERPRT